MAWFNPLQIGFTIVGSIVATIVSTQIVSYFVREKEKNLHLMGMLEMIKAISITDHNLIEAQIDKAFNNKEENIVLQFYPLPFSISTIDLIRLFSSQPEIIGNVFDVLQKREFFMSELHNKTITRERAIKFHDDFHEKIALLDFSISLLKTSWLDNIKHKVKRTLRLKKQEPKPSPKKTI